MPRISGGFNERNFVFLTIQRLRQVALFGEQLGQFLDDLPQRQDLSPALRDALLAVVGAGELAVDRLRALSIPELCS